MVVLDIRLVGFGGYCIYVCRKRERRMIADGRWKDVKVNSIRRY